MPREWGLINVVVLIRFGYYFMGILLDFEDPDLKIVVSRSRLAQRNWIVSC